MKRILFVSVLGALLAFAFSTAQAAEGMYVGAKVGLSILSDSNINGNDGYSSEYSYDNGFGLDVALGYKFPMFRLEGEAAYYANDLNGYSDRDGSGEADGDVKHLSGMINAYFDFDNASVITPYVGAGLGVAKVDLSDTTFTWDDSDTVYAYQFMGGASFALTPQLGIVAEYRYFGTQDPEFDHDDGSIKAEIESHNLMVGLRMQF
jgi:opacity protein-like surface antigen